MKIEIIRYIYNTDVRSTIGDLLINGEWFCFTLEDEIRPDDIKKYGKTAIPSGEYSVELTYSPKYKKMMPLIYNSEDDNGNKWVQGKGVRWDGIRLHGGNTEADTLGCPLVAYNTDGKKIWGSASKDLTALMKAGEIYPLTIYNKPFSYNGKHG